MRDNPRILYVSDNNLSKYEVSNKFVWFLEGEVLKIRFKEKIPHAEFFLRSKLPFNWSRNSPLVESKNLLLCSWEPASGPCPEPNEFMVLFNVILPSTPRFPRL
jgi:hypothetical protein